MFRAFVFLCFLLALSVFSPYAFAKNTGEDDLLARDMVSHGVKRKYYVHVPRSYDPGRPIPLVLAFHQVNQSAPEFSELTGFNTISDKYNFLVVYPEAVKGVWNDGRNASWAHLYDDQAFIDKLVDFLELKWNVDRSRVYAAGYGGGGFFCQYLALQSPAKYAAFASVAGTMPEILFHKRKASQPISIMLILGMKDEIVPFNGGPAGSGRLGKRTHRLVSASSLVDYWVKAGKCSNQFQHGQVPDLDPTDGTTVKWLHYKNCQGEAEVVLLAVEDGGHTWPGAKKILSERKYGLTCKDLDASREIWRFFSKHSLAGSR